MANDNMQYLAFNVPGMTGTFAATDAEARAQLKNKLDATALPEAIDTALAQAKASGEFDGAPGYTPVKDKDYFDGKDGISPTVAVSDITGGHRISITDKSGTRTVDVMDGEKGDPGHTPVRGTDYYTEEDVAAINAEAQTYIDEQLANLDISGGGSGSMPVVTTTGSGSSYSATVPGIDALTRGAHFIMIPHANSNKTAPKLNVNGLGEKTLRMQKPVNAAMSATPSNVDWLRGNYPVLVIYDGSYWVVLMPYVDAEAFRGVLTPAKGGLGTKSIDEATALLVTSESIQSALGYTPADVANAPVKGTDYWTPEDKASVVADVLTILDASAAARVVVDTDNNITLSGDLANGTYTLRYENTDGSTVKICDMTVTDGTADPDVPDEPSVNYTNLVPTALTHTDTTTVFNAADTPGYKDGAYASSAAPYYGSDSTTVCTGLFPADAGSVYYIKGVTFDESNSHFRFGFAKAANATISTYKVTDPESMQDAMTVEELGTQYYKVTLNASYVKANWPDLAYMWFSAVGTGENLIVTANEPIE